MSCTPPKTLNFTRGVVYCKDLMIYSKEVLADKLKNQGVVKVEYIKKINGILIPTSFPIISFNAQILPLR